eukprot:TRINITY_DN9129_c0_g1_i3.p1 TRINITY_DN9129_c0_g1~~TRINITY_DN9129_c0_g1_i3.p1  ORF type:complete len:419 (+),score=67.15 TRINITY_DN9129_c0_g1_i3:77-1333(+)
MGRPKCDAGAGPIAVALRQAGLLTHRGGQLRSHHKTKRRSAGAGTRPFVNVKDDCDWEYDRSDGFWSKRFYNAIEALVGTWTCQLGSLYYVTPDTTKQGMTCSVKTVRKNGRTRVTRALIKQHEVHSGMIVVTWGQGFVLQTSRDFPRHLTWAPRRSTGKPFYWMRRSPCERWGSGGVQGHGDALATTPRKSALVNHPRRDTALAKPWKSTPPSSRRTSFASTMEPPTISRTPRMSMGTGSRTSLGSTVTTSTRNDLASERRLSWGSIGDEDLASAEELAALAWREEQLEVRAATLRLREATVNLQEAQSAKRKLAAAHDDRVAVTAEVATLTEKRNSEQELLEDYCAEEERMRRKLECCREVVSTTVASIDHLLGETGAQDDEAHEALSAAREEAEAASAQAASILVSLGSGEANKL